MFATRFTALKIQTGFLYVPRVLRFVFEMSSIWYVTGLWIRVNKSCVLVIRQALCLSASLCHQDKGVSGTTSFSYCYNKMEVKDWNVRMEMFPSAENTVFPNALFENYIGHDINLYCFTANNFTIITLHTVRNFILCILICDIIMQHGCRKLFQIKVFISSLFIRYIIQVYAVPIPLRCINKVQFKLHVKCLVTTTTVRVAKQLLVQTKIPSSIKICL
jgi:hypothetical protein